MNRRDFLRWSGASVGAGLAASAFSVAGCAAADRNARRAARVLVLGGGFSGATAARYLRLWAPEIEVTLIERNASFISCPLSNLVLGGSRTLGDLIHGYDALQARHRAKVVQADVTAIDAVKKTVTTRAGNFGYDRLIIAPGIDFMYDSLPMLASAEAQLRIPHAWKAGAQTTQLRNQLEAMPDGGVFVLSIPKTPYRCPPGPYERACQVAHYFKTYKPRSKVIILDANPEVVSKKGLFTKAWADLYADMVEYRPTQIVEAVDLDAMTVQTELDAVRGDVINLIPPQQAGRLAALAAAINVDQRWCKVDFVTYESTSAPGVHVIGDAVASGLPKSGHMANQTGKVCAAAVIALLNGDQPNPQPVFSNTCYSFVSDKEAISVAGVFRYDPEKKDMVAVKEAGGVSDRPTQSEANYANAWARNIWADTLY